MIVKAHKSLSEWVDDLEQVGRYSFARDEASRDLDQEAAALDKALQRLCRHGRLLRIRKGFYVVVPLEYARVGTVPPDWFLADLMKYFDSPYYLGCLSAAVLHGAAHQRPQEMQVVVPGRIRDIDIPQVRIRFLRFSGMEAAMTQPHRTHTGDIPVSTPEWTAIDLIRFQKHYGSTDAAATVLAELAEMLDAKNLVSAARRESCSAYLQRLGWMLDFLGFEAMSRPLAYNVKKRHPRYAPLNPSIEKQDGDHDPRWMVVVNEKPESDL